MNNKQFIFRYWGTIDMSKALVHQTPDAIKRAYALHFGVTPYKVKMVGRKLTRYHTHRHFIAYFGLDTHPMLRQKLDAAGTSECHDENGTVRLTFWFGDDYTVTTDYMPLKSLPQDLGQAMSYDVEAPTTPRVKHRKRNRHRRVSRQQVVIPPTAGTPAGSPLEVR